MKYFKGSLLVTIIGFICAFFWAEHKVAGSGLTSLFIVGVLAILEISLSFDNAVINAVKLEKMTEIWKKRFLTWGIAIAVFGMRFVFPVLIVAVFAKISMYNVAKMALTDSAQYTHYLHLSHAPIVSFGGAFLLMLFLSYFFNKEKKLFWIEWIECKLAHCGRIKGIETILTVIAIFITQHFLPANDKLSVMTAGLFGLVLYLLIDGLTHYLEHREQENAKSIGDTVKKGGLVAFLYLELIDASFSLDGVLGAFALSKDILIISIGLAIGAMFVRSLTILLVEKKTLEKFQFLEHGAHWAIGVLALIMFTSTIKEVPEVITGGLGLAFIVAALISSIAQNKKGKA